ncbi:hypothetical protein BKA62DRAFT_760492 [Auriculariales sp. MPI-PUGE-AT-0066]|nr:hypothetical protein BKA62DRAFT_760492 [Auriculariales sp. MPI-PUGE-AT-0066]
MSLVSYPAPFSAASGVWIYSPDRNGQPTSSWNAIHLGNSTSTGTFYFRTQTFTSSISLEFLGTGLLLCFNDNDATYVITLDGKPAAAEEVAHDETCDNFGSSHTFLINDLNFESHLLWLNVTGGSPAHEFQFYGGVLETKILVDSANDQVDIKIIDDRAPEWVMHRVDAQSAGWDTAERQDWDNGTASFTCGSWGISDVSAASYKFSGASAVILKSTPGPGTYAYSVVLNDQTFNSRLSVGSDQLPSVPVFFQTNLDPSKSYIISLRNYNDADGNFCSGNNGCCATLDSLYLLGSKTALEGGPAPALPSPSTSISSVLSSSTTGQSATEASRVTSGTYSSTSSVRSSATEQSATEASRVTSGAYSSASSVNVPAVVGGVAGGIALCLLVVFGLFLYRRKRKAEMVHHSVTTPYPEMQPTAAGPFVAKEHSSQSFNGASSFNPSAPSWSRSDTSPSRHLSSSQYESEFLPEIGAPVHPTKGELLAQRAPGSSSPKSAGQSNINSAVDENPISLRESLPAYSAVYHGRTGHG